MNIKFPKESNLPELPTQLQNKTSIIEAEPVEDVKEVVKEEPTIQEPQISLQEAFYIIEQRLNALEAALLRIRGAI